MLWNIYPFIVVMTLIFAFKMLINIHNFNVGAPTAVGVPKYSTYLTTAYDLTESVPETEILLELKCNYISKKEGGVDE
jgi:hypothetical protein